MAPLLALAVTRRPKVPKCPSRDFTSTIAFPTSLQRGLPRIRKVPIIHQFKQFLLIFRITKIRGSTVRKVTLIRELSLQFLNNGKFHIPEDNRNLITFICQHFQHIGKVKLGLQGSISSCFTCSAM